MKPLLVTPRDYQIEGAQKLVKNKKVILGDEMGVGKTGTAALAWREIGMKGPALLIGRPAAQAVWIQQADQWGIQPPMTITGTPKQRQAIWEDMDYTWFGSCTIQVLRNDLNSGIAPKGLPVLIYDEVHRANNRKSENWATLKKVACEYFWGLTGSPMRKGFWDLWALLNLCDPKAFSSYWNYVQTFGLTQRDEMDHWEVLCLNPAAATAFGRKIYPHFIRREKKDVLPELPPKQRILDRRIPEMQPRQLKLYKQLESELIGELSDGEIIIAQNQLVKLLRLRQILCTPKILDPSFPEWGASLEYLGDMIEETQDHHFVVYTPFAEAIQYISAFLSTRLPDTPVFSFRGGVMNPQQIVDHAKSFKETRGIAVCSIAFAESFELTPAEWAYFNGFSWSLIENLQAEDRQHRMTTTASISYYYPMHVGGVDLELMAPVLDEKAGHTLDVYRTHKRLRDVLIRARDNR
jgi:SNF2 family DNA or RNA helicase